MTIHDNFFSCDYFALFALSPSMAIDDEQLRKKYHGLQSATHPDRFVAATAAEKSAALQMTSRINVAYQTLREPQQRAAYILSLRDVEAFGEDNTAMPSDFLMQQIAWREAMEEAQDEPSALAALRAEIGAAAAAAQQQTTDYIAAEDNAAAADALRQWRYLAKMLADIS